MKYNQEDLYKTIGQFDKVVVVDFIPDSEAYKKYGPSVTGILYYTPKERIKFEKSIQLDSEIKSFGKLKIDVDLDISAEQKKELKRKGVEILEIAVIHHFFSKEKEYDFSGKRKLHPPIEIQFDASDMTSAYVANMHLNLYTSIINKGDRLTPFEFIEFNSALIDLYFDELPKDFLSKFIDPKTGQIKEEIRYQSLLLKFENDELNKSEKLEFEKLLEKEGKRRFDILKKELEKSTEKVKDIFQENPRIMKWFSALIVTFKPKRFTFGKIPVWWDFERFIHIFLRHVEETQVGERNKDRGRFQYEIGEVQSVIQLILNRLNEEIQQFFTDNPGKDFNRHGEMAVYFKGDYYAMHIRYDGRLMTFYKIGPNKN